MPTLYAVLGVLAVLWLIGWALACVVDITIARWPEAAHARHAAPPTAVRWLLLLAIWPLTLRAVLGNPRRRTR